MSLSACAAPKHVPQNQMGDSIRFEVGVEDQAMRLAGPLPEVMRKIEQRHRHRYKQPPVIYIFASDEGFERATGYHGHRVAGLSTPTGVYLSPEGAEPLQTVLAHELSHVLLRQWVGDYGFHRVPIWFREGLATWASNGGGAGQVDAEQASIAILEGHTFDPNLKEGLIFRKDAGYWDLAHPLFYRQSALFVGFLAEADPESWANLLVEVHRGTGFADAFARTYDTDMQTLWRSFVESLSD